MEEFRIIDIIGSPNAILHGQGLKVFNFIKPFIANDIAVCLSFDSIRNVTSGFCNASIGKVYLDFQNAQFLLKLANYENNQIWIEKIQDAIKLAVNPDKIKLQDEAISELFSS